METLFKDRLIGFFDVLGFSNQLKNTDLKLLLRNFSSFTDYVNSDIFSGMSKSRNYPDKIAKAKFIFDSIVLVSHPVIDKRSVSDFIAACLSLMEKGFLHQWPLRGAIGFGDYLEDEKSGVFLSPIFPDIVRAEAAQNWCGCCVLPDCEALVREIYSCWATDICSSPLIEYNPPFKEQSAYNIENKLLCLNFSCFIPKDKLESRLEHLIEPKRTDTRRFIEFVNNLRDDSIRLGDEFYPAVLVKSMKMGYVFRVEFYDSQGQVVQPASNNYTMSFGVDGWSIRMNN